MNDLLPRTGWYVPVYPFVVTVTSPSFLVSLSDRVSERTQKLPFCSVPSPMFNLTQ